MVEDVRSPDPEYLGKRGAIDTCGVGDCLLERCMHGPKKMGKTRSRVPPFLPHSIDRLFEYLVGHKEDSSESKSSRS